MTTDLAYEEWLEWTAEISKSPRLIDLFRSPSEEENWPEVSDEANVRHMTAFFSMPVFEKYGEKSVSEMLWHLPTADGPMYSVAQAEIGWEMRREAVKAIGSLYERLALPLIGNIFGKQNKSKLGVALFMFWDNTCLFPASLADEDRSKMIDLIFDVLEAQLALPSWACQEAALHGLNHFRPGFEERIDEIGRVYLESKSDLPPSLRSYAIDAIKGCVL